jgi:glycosyltransferase involved in cell wall biosynthesis
MPPSHSPTGRSARAEPPPLTVSVVIPVHNEAYYVEDALGDLLTELDAAEVSTGAFIEVIVAENGSTDDTADRVAAMAGASPRLSLLRLPVPDYGAAMREGFLTSDGDWVVNFDIDYYSGDFLVAAVGHEDADVVLASKRAPGSEDRRSIFRRTATWGFNVLLRTVLESNVSDTHGMKAIRRTVIDAVAGDVGSTEDLFDTELVIRAERAGFRIVELPVTVEERRESRSRLARRIPRTLRGLWHIRRDLG